ncbi:MAG: hypothetical protein ACTSWA_06565 [Candidatus Thorarchaeota archaeon]
MSRKNDESQERIKQIVIGMLKTLDKLSEGVDICGEHVGPFTYPLVRVLHECKEGTRIAVEAYEYDVRNENRVDYESLHGVYETLLDTPEFKEFESALRDYFGDTYPEKSMAFLQTAIEGNVDRNTMIARVVDEITQSPVEWTFKLFFQGLKLDEESFEFDNLVLRKITPSDFQEKSPWRINLESGFVPAHSVVEWTTTDIPKGYKNKPQRVSEIIEKLVRLKLVKSGLFKVSAWSARTPYLLENSDDFALLDSDPLLLGISPIRRIPEPVSFGVTEKERYLRFTKNVFPYLEKNQNQKINFALKMLSEAAWKPIDEAILFCVIGLESLFLLNEGELRHKLASRVAVIMKHMGKDAESIYDDVRIAYGIRNKFVHGSFRDTLTEMEKESLLLKLSEYLSESVVIWIQLLSMNRTPKSILDILDRAVFSIETEKGLKALLKSIAI